MYSSDNSGEDLNFLSSTVVDVNPMAYIRPVKTEKGAGFGVFAADGTQLAVFASQEAAYFAAKQHNLEPVLIH